MASGLRHLDLEPLHEPDPVGEPGERIDERALRDVRLLAPPVRDVEENADHGGAAVPHRRGLVDLDVDLFPVPADHAEAVGAGRHRPGGGPEPVENERPVVRNGDHRRGLESE